MPSDPASADIESRENPYAAPAVERTSSELSDESARAIRLAHLGREKAIRRVAWISFVGAIVWVLPTFGSLVILLPMMLRGGRGDGRIALSAADALRANSRCSCTGQRVHVGPVDCAVHRASIAALMGALVHDRTGDCGLVRRRHCRLRAVKRLRQALARRSPRHGPHGRAIRNRAVRTAQPSERQGLHEEIPRGRRQDAGDAFLRCARRWRNRPEPEHSGGTPAANVRPSGANARHFTAVIPCVVLPGGSV